MATDGMIKTRKRVQQAVEQAEAEQRRQMMLKRIEMASTGLKAFRDHKPVEAARNFQMYLRIMEDWKGASEGGLNPSLFDVKKEQAELLLISGIYWDLVKLYDRTKSDKKHKEFLHYLEKYILFSKGMPFQALCAETLRKYLAVEKPRHKEDFKNAYRIIAVSKCFVATALADVTHVDTMPRLRSFRDEVLMRSRAGRVAVRAYYRFGPLSADVVANLPEPLRVLMAKALDRFARRI